MQEYNVLVLEGGKKIMVPPYNEPPKKAIKMIAKAMGDTPANIREALYVEYIATVGEQMKGIVNDMGAAFTGATLIVPSEDIASRLKAMYFKNASTDGVDISELRGLIGLDGNGNKV